MKTTPTFQRRTVLGAAHSPPQRDDDSGVDRGVQPHFRVDLHAAERRTLGEHRVLERAARSGPLGAGLGLVFVPCGGPVLATIAALGAVTLAAGYLPARRAGRTDPAKVLRE